MMGPSESVIGGADLTAHGRLTASTAWAIAFTLASVTADPAWARQDGAVGAGLPAFLVNESQAGDLNADGDAVDAVLHVFDTKQRMAVNLGLAAASICRAIVGPPSTTCDLVSPVIGRTVVAFLVAELAQGETNLNGDADAADDVLHLYDAATGRIINTGLAVGHAVGRDVSSYTFPLMPVVSGGGIALLVGEAEQGATDLNLDGDIEDDVLHLIEPKVLETLNLELAAAVISGPFGARNPMPLQLEKGHVASSPARSSRAVSISTAMATATIRAPIC